MFKSNHSDLLKAALDASDLSAESFYAGCGVTRSGASRWRSRNWIPENRRKAVADLSGGAVKLDDFTAAWQLD